MHPASCTVAFVTLKLGLCPAVVLRKHARLQLPCLIYRIRAFPCIVHDCGVLPVPQTSTERLDNACNCEKAPAVDARTRPASFCCQLEASVPPPPNGFGIRPTAIIPSSRG
jgi:hypothetical protein